MTVFQRILRYLLLWVALFAILCVVSIARHWDIFSAMMASAFSAYLSGILYIVLVGGIIIGLFVMLFRPLFR